MFEEVKEMIDSTVYQNGNGEVTAQNINLALHGIVEATADEITEVDNKVNQLGEKVAEIGENGTGGSGALRVWMNTAAGLENTPEQVAENIATYNTLISGESAPVIACIVMNEDGEGVTYNMYTTTPVESQVLVVDVPEQPDLSYTIVAFSVNADDSGTVQLHPDGSVTFEEPATPSTPSSGPLRVWINEENTPEQTAENVATRNSLLANPYQSVLICYELDYTEYGSGIIKQANTMDSVTVGDGEVAISIIKQNLDGDQNIISQKLESLFIQEDGTILSE